MPLPPGENSIYAPDRHNFLDSRTENVERGYKKQHHPYYMRSTQRKDLNQTTHCTHKDRKGGAKKIREQI